MTTQTNRRPAGARRGNSNLNRRRSHGGRAGGRRRFHGGNSRSRARGSNKRNQPTFNPSQFINKNPIEVKEEVYEAKNSFEDFGFHPVITKSLQEQGIETPSPIQDQVIPRGLHGLVSAELRQSWIGCEKPKRQDVTYSLR